VPPDASQLPHEIKIYGLHVNASSDKKSVEQADLKDSVAVATQSEKHKSATKQSSAPNFVLKDIFFIAVIVCILLVVVRCKRFLKYLIP
jgi:hypothetical protein